MWKRIKEWWLKVKAWLAKNKKIIALVIASFATGFITAFSSYARGNARVKQHLAELENQLGVCRNLNARLQELGAELTKQTESLTYTGDELRHQHDIIAELAGETESTIGRAREELAVIESGLAEAQGSAGEFAELDSRLSEIGNGLGTSIQRLEDFISKYGT